MRVIRRIAAPWLISKLREQLTVLKRDVGDDNQFAEELPQGNVDGPAK